MISKNILTKAFVHVKRCTGPILQKKHIASAAAIKEQMVRKSVESVLHDIAIDDPTTVHFQPDFDSSFRGVRTKIDESLLNEVKNVDPFELVSKDIQQLSSNIKELLGSDHPVLSTVAKYFFSQDGGKKVRPALVLLMARAADAHAQSKLDTPDSGKYETNVLPTQLRLAEITEMIHTASLLHDDVIDMADTRRGVKSVNQTFGNKLAVLAGDFLLARASVCLARLRNIEVIELLSTVIEHLVKGEVMQMRGEAKGNEAFEYYLRKNYYKTGSLMANSILASTILGGHDKETQEIAFNYGVAVGQAFQLVDDALDFEGSLQSMGKPALADLKQGFATAPVLFAQEEFPELRPLIDRKFSGSTDIDDAAEYVTSSNSIRQTRELATAYSERAIEEIRKLAPSPERDALIRLSILVVNREK